MYKVNIIIPSITIDSRLIRCLNGIQKLKYKRFFVTLVLENKKNLHKLKKFKFSIKTLITQKINMSDKRNFAAKKFNSDYLAFIDSDASPNKNWLNSALKILKSKKIKIIGGPNMPFKNENFCQKISHAFFHDSIIFLIPLHLKVLFWGVKKWMKTLMKKWKLWPRGMKNQKSLTLKRFQH